MRLIISEKPSVGVAYSRALGISGKKDGYIEGKNDIVTWCVGHLVELANADVYDERYKKWNISDLPIIPDKWQYIVSTDKNKQFNVVRKLMNDPRITEVVCGTDAGREGELIFRLVYEKSGCKLPIKRLWISSMEDKAIIEGFNNLRNGADYDNLYHSALCRSKADWIVGINATRLFTKLYNKKLSVGRVQTPTLAMLYERNNAISGFVKEKYHNVCLCFSIYKDKELIAVEGVSDKIKEHSEAVKMKADCDNNTAVVRSVKREHKSVNPPKLYDLTTLQREANRLYGFTAQQTLDYTQSLYEARLVTYPRTDSQFLTDDIADTANKIIEIVRNNIPCFNGVSYTPDVSRIINGKKVTDHTGIIPTAELSSAKLDGIPDGERKVLLLIANKLLCATADKYEYEAVTAVIECNGYSFTAKGKTVINNGWKAIERLLRSDDSDSEDNSNNSLDLDLQEGQTFEKPVCNITEHFTQPPKAFTEDTLLSAMNNAGTEEITEDVERSGLGTPATRAGIIEKMIKSGFIKRDKKNIVVTTEGAELISLMPDFVKSAKLTAEWENTLSLIAKGEYSPDDFMENISKLTSEIISSAKENVNPDKVAKFDKKGDVIGKCPRCKSDVCETPKAYSCGCGFALWKNNKFFESAKKEFTKEIAAALIKNGKVDVSGLYSQKSGKTYNATVCLDDTGKYVNLRLEFKKKS